MNEDSNEFVAELRRWREVRGLSRTALARRMGYSRPYVSKIESGDEPGSLEFAAHAETVLQAGGALRQAWQTRQPVELPVPTSSAPAGGEGLVVDHDEAELAYDDGLYRATMRRRLVNEGDAPVTRYLIRISVDRYPDDPERSNQLYRESPLTWDELDLHAWHGSHRDSEVQWSVQHDRDAFKEVWLLLRCGDRHFPLYPGQDAWIEYTYTVPANKWGNWFRRSVRVPTRTMSVTLDFPTRLQPSAWGLHTSLVAESLPLPTPIEVERAPERTRFSWHTQDPPLHARYKLEWCMEHDAHPTPPAPQPKPSETMAQLGILQRGDPRLRQPAERFSLPDEATEAGRIGNELQEAADRVSRAHTFSKGMGIAAPQLGSTRAAALVRHPGSEETVTLINPRIIDTSTETDHQYEGCLSSFDVRCRIPRPLAIDVEHQDPDGTVRITRFERGPARLVCHEIDHLDGILCDDHLPEGQAPIPVEQYRGTGTGWHYV